MNCADARNEIDAYVLGALAEREAGAVAAHLLTLALERASSLVLPVRRLDEPVASSRVAFA